MKWDYLSINKHFNQKAVKRYSIDQIHENLDGQIMEALNHFNTNDFEPYTDWKDKEFETFRDYITQYNNLKYIPPEEEYDNVLRSDTGYWYYEVAGSGVLYQYKFYMNEPLQEKPSAIYFWYIHSGRPGYTNDEREIGQAIWDHLEEERYQIIEYSTEG